MEAQKKKPNTRTMVPKILQDITNFLVAFIISISDPVGGEGRGGSQKDEVNVKKALFESEYKEYIIDQKVRKAGDILVRDYDGITTHVVNIKTSGNKSSDNCFSKAGLVYALTDLKIEEIPGAMNFMKMNELIKNHKADIPEKDYWFLCINKKNPSEVTIRGAKQIKNWVVNINPSNILQINWKKEKSCGPVERTWEEAREIIIGGAIRSLNEFWKNIPEEWKWDCNSSNTK